MKKLSSLLLLFMIAVSQAQTVNYTATTENFANPERGQYHYQSTGENGYQALTNSDIKNYRNNEKITLVWREFYLGAFRTTAITQDYLNKMQADFNVIRNAGLKCIVRFNYSNTNSNDATKAQILAHIAQLKPVVQANEDVISSLEAGFIGDYGEWYYSSYFGQDNLTAQNIADRTEVANKIMELAPNRMVAFRTPGIMKQVTGTTPVSSTAAFNGTIKSRVASHNDCFLSSADDWGTYDGAADYTYLENQSKFTFDGGETCSLTTYSACANALATMAKYHFNYLNTDYNKSVLNNWKSSGCYDEAIRKLGYRFELLNSNVANNSLTITLQNVGNGNVINDRKAFLVMRNALTGAETSFLLNTNVRLWNAGSQTQIVQNLASLGLADGTYSMFLNIPDRQMPTNPSYSIRCANNNIWDETKGYNNLNRTFTVGSGAPIIVGLPVDIILVDNSIITMANLPSPIFTIQVYNSNGKLKSTSVNISALKKGVYIVKVTCAGVVTTKTILKA